MNKKIKLAIIFLFVCGGTFAFTRTGQMQTAQPQTTPTPATSAAPQSSVVTAGQKFKNIKVLNDMPADQLGKVMNIMSASLGVRCNFCHVTDDFSKDTKEEKESARKMITMTLGINKNSFNGRTEISCNTCHQGKTHPVNLPSLGEVTPAPPRTPDDPKTRPTIDQLLDKYYAALGGKDKLDKITTRTVKASRVEPDGKTTEVEEVYQKAPNKSLMVTTYPKAVVSEAFDGTAAWKRTETGPINISIADMDLIKREADFFQPTRLKDIYPQMSVAFMDKINGRDVYQVRATTAAGARDRLFFDVETGLLVRRSEVVATLLGNYQVQIDYEDYKDVEGIKIPMTIRWSMPNMGWTRKVLEVKNNTPIDDAKFTSPAK